jgi:hypothetical protein
MLLPFEVLLSVLVAAIRGCDRAQASPAMVSAQLSFLFM